jgi:hypothetical protein
LILTGLSNLGLRPLPCQNRLNIFKNLGFIAFFCCKELHQNGMPEAKSLHQTGSD